MSENPPSSEPAAAPRPRRLRRYALRGTLGTLGFAVLYLLAVLVLGWIPVNRDWVPAEEGVEIRVWSNGVHTDFVVPVRTEAMDWSGFASLANDRRPEPWDRYVVIGWGDRDFYIETPTAEDFSLATTLKAILLPTASVMHLNYYDHLPEPADKCVKLLLREREFRTLTDYIRDGFALDDHGRPKRIEGANYGPDDAFYVAKDSYHLFNTCNNWANRALRRTGIKTAAWSPFDYAIFDHVKN